MQTRYSTPSVRLARLFILALGAALLSGCGDDRSPASELALGQEPYLRWCASCHGNQGEGRPPAFPPLAGSEWLEELPDQGLALIILYGLRGEIQVAGRTYRGYMPPMQHLSDGDIADILSFMQSAWGSRESALSAADIAGLRLAFDGRRPPLEGWDGVIEALEALP